MRIPFFKATLTGNEQQYVTQVLQNNESFYTKEFIGRCQQWFAENHGLREFYLTKSCSHSLELAMLALDLEPGDEVIMPSYAFVSCANAVALRGAICVYVDIEPNWMNLDVTKVSAAITSKTKAIVTINYSGVGCNYEALRRIADKHKLYIVEDNAHGTGAKYKGHFLGTHGDISCFSFDHLKNITCGQGGGIAINNPGLLERFYIAYEFGTDRRNFFHGKTNRYEWKNTGSNFALGELDAAMLYGQLQLCNTINNRFVELWNLYADKLEPLEQEQKITLAHYPDDIAHNGHCFFIKAKDHDEKNVLMKFLHDKGINAQFHYTPLHNSEYGAKAGRFAGVDEYTSTESNKLLRLPLFYSMGNDELQQVVDAVIEFYT